jgi:NAD-dependent dihydropyrimidine dehydrogenase PreA subunit
LLDTYLREVVSYSAMKAQDDYEGKASAKGPQLKIGNNHKLAEKIEDYITEKKYSPYSTIKELRDDPDYQKTPICERTLYNYIDRELLLNVTKKDLPRKGKKSLCGPKCDICTNVCPGNAVKGKLWEAEIDRDILLDPHACRRAARQHAKENLGVEETLCALCISNCPWTKNALNYE